MAGGAGASREGLGVRDAPGGEGAGKSKIHPALIPGNLVRNDFWLVRRSSRGSGAACFWATSFGKISAAWLCSSRSA